MILRQNPEFDYALVGGGLQNALIALGIFRLRPEARIALVEREPTLGGNHVWCFHAGDIPQALEPAVAPLVVKAWDNYDVFFPGLERRVERSYSAVSSHRLEHTLEAAFAARPSSLLLRGVAVEHASAHELALSNGTRLRAKVVVRATGPSPNLFPGRVGFQKFLGLELELERPSSLTSPILIDARVPQLDGFRFLYVLPLAEDRVLLEDTRYSSSQELQRDELRKGILEYAKARGLCVARVVREETGVLPLPLGRLNGSNPAQDAPFVAGYEGGFFHPTTGYSFPVAARLALLFACVEPRELANAWPRLRDGHRQQFGFYTLLNRLMFGAFTPEQRYGAIEQFYRLPEACLQRFYAMTLTRSDRARIFCTRPPRGFSLRLALSQGSPR
jgi:lycopene beta-cyclase